MNEPQQIIKGSLGELVGIPFYESKLVPEGTYTFIDKDGLPIPKKDLKTRAVVKILVHDIETFKIAMERNDHAE